MKVIKNKKYAYFSFAILLAGTLLYIFPPHLAATNAQDCSSGCSGTDSVSAEWQWSVNVQEVLSMTITEPSDTEKGATGDVEQFLRDKYTLKVTSNNGTGFTAGMTTKTADTNLAHTTSALTASQTIPTLTEAAGKCTDEKCSTFTANHWGYSLDETSDTETPAGTYKPMVGSTSAPITVLSSENQTTGTKDIYFGAKADSSKASGTYLGTVVFTVTSGTNGSDLPVQTPAAQPNNPEGPSADAPAMNPQLSYTPSTYTYTTNNRTYRSNASSIATASPATEDNKKKEQGSTASDFVSPLGVNDKVSTVSNIQHGSIITTVLMIVAFLAAGVGIFFFILAKRDNDEDEDEIQQV